MLTRAVVVRVMRALVTAWETDWTMATSDELWRQLSLEAKTDTFVGWMTWVPRADGAVRHLPDPARVEDKGSIVVLTPEPLRSNDREHLALARQVQRSLEAGSSCSSGSLGEQQRADFRFASGKEERPAGSASEPFLDCYQRRCRWRSL
ncbi:Imm52 family immunity protein [Vitiosangium sp. GDMCC 1.1324]|uniref:Imm52 family immunity protein n=1 Tax=Vitiosangium sp. (strain GDMCC 1.1324) TaxID=2138576 RepID=UPI000D331DB0|nr:Imm52 family immunity protein [Vitiosangium sp. GDMCC 1.1324]PTL74934.1 hypothetical protein DAT35_57665 [Vitiosangium sp. GDMCC 1.1324]